MNFLLVGGGSSMMDAMIDKLRKSGHRVYLLTGRKDNYFTYKRVVKRYDFSYESDSVKDVIESARPDVILYMGAYDTNFDWYRKAQQESVRYIASLVNILSMYAMAGQGRFVYLSSQEVYSDDTYINNIREEEAVTPKGYRALAISQGEEICSNYLHTQGLNICILRLDHVYGIPKRGQPADMDPCFHMCMEGFRTGKISANSNNKFSMLFLNDAVELSYKAITAGEQAQSLYHISSMEEISETQLAQMIIKEMGASVELADNTVGMGHRHVLDGNQYKEEYGQKIFVNYQEGVKKVVSYLKHNYNSYLSMAEANEGMGRRVGVLIRRILASLVPFFENLVCFFVFYVLSSRAGTDRYFEKLDFYLLYVLLFAIVHGQQQAIVSAFLASLGFFFQQTAFKSGFETLLDYNIYVWTAQLFIVGMTVGYIRDRLNKVTEEKDEEIRYLRQRIADIEEINESNVKMKQEFEIQLVNQRNSLGKIYEITSKLEKYAPEEILFYAAEALGELMSSKDIAIYVVANRSYARLFSATSKEARKLGNSIEYTAMEEMYKEIKERRVYINKTMNGKYPLMAYAVYAEDEMQMIAMVWDMPWQNMNLAEANRLTIMGTLTQDAVVRARRYLEALRSERYVEGLNVLRADAFEALVRAFFNARDRGLTECTLLEILTGGRDYEEAAKTLSAGIRQTDYMGILEGGGLYVLLSNTSDENAAKVAERFRDIGYESHAKRGL